jgi:BMFP domain-containing protein YqiC
MQTENRFLDGMARFLTDAAGAAQAFRAEMETMVKARFERLMSDLDLVKREEFEAVRAMAAKSRSENEKLAARVAKLEAALGAARTARGRSSAGKGSSGKRGKGNL